MKKLFTLLVILFLSTAVFAQDYVIKNIIGKVYYEVSNNKFEALTTGMELTPSTVVKTGLNSAIEVDYNGKVYTIKAKQQGTIQSLYALAAPSRGGLKKQTIAKADFEDNATGAREGVATASTRASEAKEDFAWDE